jgi:branched-chain amino acid transport system permease protein
VVYSLIPRYYFALALAAGSVSLVYLIGNSKTGLAMLTVRENEEAASASGINVFAYKVLALGISSVFAGLVGGLYTYYYPSFYYHIPFNLYWCFDPLLITFIGGVGTVMGPIVGSVLFVVLRQIFALTMGEAHVIIFGGIFILIVLLLPGGLVDAATKFRELSSSLFSRKAFLRG